MIAPVWLLGMLAASIPIIIHLLHRSRAPRVLFSTLRFLRIAVERTRRRRRVENLLLMILRTLMLALLAFALAGPVVRGKGAARVLILLDNSGSMSARYEGRSVMDHARRIAHAVMAGRAAQGAVGAVDDRFSLLFTNGPERLKERPMRSDLGSLGALLDNTHPVGEKADMIAALSVASRMLTGGPDTNRQLVILSDLQASSWEGQLAEILPSDIQIIASDLSREEHLNLAVTEVVAIGGATIAGSPVVLQATIFNASAHKVENRPVTLTAEGGVVIRKSVSIEPAKSAAVIFNPSWDVPGSYTGRVVVDTAGDPMTLDNERFFKLVIRDRIRALVIRQNPEPGYLDDAYFLVRALDPGAALGVGARSVMDPVVIDVADFSERNLADARIVFILNVEDMTISQVDLLRNLLASGGAVFFFPGDNVDGYAWMDRFKSGYLGDSRLEALVPELEDAPRTISEDRFISLAPAESEHPALEIFRPMPRSFFEAVHVRKYFPISTELTGQSHAVLSMEGNTPFMVERRVGRGRTFFFAVPANRQWSNFPLTTLYPALISELIFHVVADEVRLASYDVGDSVEMVLPELAAQVLQIDVTDPSGAVTRLVSTRQGDNSVASYADTFAPGVYTWRTEGEVEQEGSFVVNVDGDESDLSPADRKDVVRALAGREVRWTSGVEETREVARSLREERPLTAWFMFAVLAFAVFEVWLANRSRHRTAGADAILIEGTHV